MHRTRGDAGVSHSLTLLVEVPFCSGVCQDSPLLSGEIMFFSWPSVAAIRAQIGLSLAATKFFFGGTKWIKAKSRHIEVEAKSRPH